MEYINDLLTSENASFRCMMVPGKGRTLHMSKDVKSCNILFQGPLLHKVAENLRHPIYVEITRLFYFDATESLDYSPMWYWCALNSLAFKISDQLPTISEEQAKRLKMLYHPEILSPSPTIRRVVSAISHLLDHELAERELIELERMTIIWTLNCFEHADDPLTYASFFLPSFMSHSCAPTAMWTTIGDTFFIRSQRPMMEGDELTVSYLSEEFGLRPISKRKAHLLSTKFFNCDCPRCTSCVDDTRGFALPDRLGLPDTCFVRFPQFYSCACGCARPIDLKDSDRDHLIDLETMVVDQVTTYDGAEEEDEDIIPTRTNPELIGTDEAALDLEDYICELGLFHWASVRGLMQLAEYYKHNAQYPKAIALTKLRIEGKRKYVNLCPSETSSSLAWALEELGDLIMLHVSGAVVAGLSEEARERFADSWKPKSDDDLETLKFSGAIEAYTGATQILIDVFGEEHEHTRTASLKLHRVSSLISSF